MMKKLLFVTIACLALFSPAVLSSTTQMKKICECDDDVDRLVDSLEESYEHFRTGLINPEDAWAGRSTELTEQNPGLRALPLLIPLAVTAGEVLFRIFKRK